MSPLLSLIFSKRQGSGVAALNERECGFSGNLTPNPFPRGKGDNRPRKNRYAATFVVPCIAGISGLQM